MNTDIPFEISLIRKYLRKRALYCITQSLQEKVNRYKITVEPLKENRPFKLEEKTVSYLNILPVGSRWSPVINWHSFFGVPAIVDGKEVLTLGIHRVEPNPFGGAFPYTEAYVFRFDYSLPLAGVSRLLKELLPSLDLSTYGTGIVKSSSDTPEDYQLTEAKIIQSALKSYQHALEIKFRKEPLLYFQSLILSEDQLMKPGLPRPRWWGDRSGYLFGVRTQLVTDFSWKTKFALFMSQAS